MNTYVFSYVNNAYENLDDLQQILDTRRIMDLKIDILEIRVIVIVGENRWRHFKINKC